MFFPASFFFAATIKVIWRNPRTEDNINKIFYRTITGHINAILVCRRVKSAPQVDSVSAVRVGNPPDAHNFQRPQGGLRPLHSGPDRRNNRLLIDALLFRADSNITGVFLSPKLEFEVAVALGQLGQPGSVT